MAFEVDPSAYNYGNPVKNFMEGMQAGYMPRQMQDEAKTRALQQQILQAQAQYAPQQSAADLQGQELKNKYLQAQTDYYPQEMAAKNKPAGEFSQLMEKWQAMPPGPEKDMFGQRLNILTTRPGGSNDPRSSGGVANAVYVENLAKQFGENDPRVVSARKALQAEYDQQKSLTNSRDAYAGSADKRASTPLGKAQLELDDINAGFMPGTGRSQAIAPEKQKQMQGEYGLKILKETSDLQARQKVLYATNIDKTIASFNPDDLVQYSGLAGGFEKMKQQGLAPLEEESQSYDKYMNAKASADMLATQVRQFYGDSIQPSMIARLESLTNPESWAKNPKLAKQNLEQIQSILKKETQTYRDATTSPDPYKGADEKGSNNTNSNNSASKDQYHDKDILELEGYGKMTAAEAREKGLI